MLVNKTGWHPKTKTDLSCSFPPLVSNQMNQALAAAGLTTSYHHFHHGHLPHSRRPTTLTPRHFHPPTPLLLQPTTEPVTPAAAAIYLHIRDCTDIANSPLIKTELAAMRGFWVLFQGLLVCTLLSVLPGGSWWNLEESEGVVNGGGGGGGEGESVTVWCVLRRVWKLLGNNQWIIFVAFGSLAIAALAEITMPRMLAASISAAERGGHMVFYRNARLLAVLCLISGISRFQRRASKLTQDFSSCANEAAEETLLSIRTVRVFGTERKELGRYEDWLQRLTFVSLRESAAYGFWNMSFNSLYRSTQVLAVMLGGISMLTDHVSAEQLMKYILYCEWLIFATWRVVDNMSSLLQAIGASEKVFQLMQLSPSDQFLSTGVKLQRLVGQVQFADVSFCYPSRPNDRPSPNVGLRLV